MTYIYLDVDNVLMRCQDNDDPSFEEATATGWVPAKKNPADIMEAAGALTERQAKALAKALGVKM